MNALHLVVGAGPVGTATAEHLADRGEQVRIVSRSGRGPERPGVERVAADAADAQRLAELARGAAVVYNCLNPAYHRWQQDWPPMAAALLHAAESAGAVLAVTDNLYPYGPVSGPITPDLPFDRGGSKGRVRARMWDDALAAHAAGRVRVVAVRASDYLTHGPNSHLGDMVVGRLVAGRSPLFLVPVDQPHTFSYVPDVAATLVSVAATERAWGQAWHVPSAPAVTPRQAAQDIAAAAGQGPASVRRVPPPVLAVLGLAVPFVREMREMAHSWSAPYVLDDARTRAELGLAESPWTDAVAAVVDRQRAAVAA